MQRRWLEKKPAPKPQESIAQVVNRTLNLFDQNQKIAAAICQLYATRSLFFLQPNAKYNYPARLYRRSLPEEFVAEATVTSQVYRRLREGKTRIDLADLFERWGHDRKAIVDDVHYSPGFNEFVARQVANAIALKTLKPRLPPIDESAATGLPRKLVHPQ